MVRHLHTCAVVLLAASSGGAFALASCGLPATSIAPLVTGSAEAASAIISAIEAARGQPLTPEERAGIVSMLAELQRDREALARLAGSACAVPDAGRDLETIAAQRETIGLLALRVADLERRLTRRVRALAARGDGGADGGDAG